MAKRKNQYGYAPKRSQRSRLTDKGYLKFFEGGNSVFDEKKAKAIAARFHAKGMLAQALHIVDADYGSWWIVMYKEKKS